jgi:hypothetical protein
MAAKRMCLNNDTNPPLGHRSIWGLNSYEDANAVDAGVRYRRASRGMQVWRVRLWLLDSIGLRPAASQYVERDEDTILFGDRAVDEVSLEREWEHVKS